MVQTGFICFICAFKKFVSDMSRHVPLDDITRASDVHESTNFIYVVIKCVRQPSKELVCV